MERLFSKLGITTRAQVATWLARHRDQPGNPGTEPGHSPLLASRPGCHRLPMTRGCEPMLMPAGTAWERLPSLNVTRPNAARIYDCLLGGKDNFEADRAEASDCSRSIRRWGAWPGRTQELRRGRPRHQECACGRGLAQDASDTGHGHPAAIELTEHPQKTKVISQNEWWCLVSVKRKPSVIVAGAGIGGLTLALELHAAGIGA